MSNRARLTDLEHRLSKVHVLVADRDARTASLVNSVLRSFGFRSIELATEPQHVLDALRKKSFGFIITEWQLASSDGINLVESIRRADKSQLRRDIPIIMLTGRSDVQAVKRARDAGITEFLAKPFSAYTMSHRLIQVIDFPRIFIQGNEYIGPCRRRRGEPPPGEQERRGARKKSEFELPANRELQEIIGRDVRASDIFTDELVQAAQSELQKQEAVFISWASEDIATLEEAYRVLQAIPGDEAARSIMLQAAYAIKSQAGMFGYDLGTQVAGNLVDYLEGHAMLDGDKLTVLRKHIDTIAVIFQQKIKDAGAALGNELISSLHKLIEKLG